MKIRFLGHAAFILEDQVKVAIDPFRVKITEVMDYIFITHDHYDHCSPEDIARLADPATTVIITPPDSAGKVQAYGRQIVEVEPGKEYDPGIRFKTIPAYNKRKPFHLQSNHWVGYLIFLGKSVYHCGDTDFIPEMQGLKPDVFLVAVGGTYTMNPQQAAEAVQAVNPQRVIPMHYGAIVGSRKDAETLKELVKIPVDIMDAE